MIVQQFQKFQVKNKWPRPFYLAELSHMRLAIPCIKKCVNDIKIQNTIY